MKAAKGFTLVELVMVIVILGVIVIGVSNFTGYGIQVYTDNAAIERTLAQSRFAIERMTRDIRSAVPNSIRHSDDRKCLQLIPIQSAGSYIKAPVLPDEANSMVVFASSKPEGAYITIGARKQQELYNDSFEGEDDSIDWGEAVARFDPLDPPIPNENDEYTLSIEKWDSNVPMSFITASDRSRYYIFKYAVTYCVLGNGDLIRQQQDVWSAGADVFTSLMAENITDQEFFSFRESDAVGAALVVLQPEFEVLGEAFRYNHQVQVVNAP